MPKLFLWNGISIFFFSNEGIPLEPCHVHVKKESNLAKFWVGEKSISLAENYGFGSKELKEILIFIEENSLEIRRKWNEYFS